MPLEYPLLSNPISVDIQKLNEILDALTKSNPTEVSGISTGAKRLIEVSSGKWQFQEFKGETWAAVPFLQHNVDQLDGYHAAITPAANTVAVRNASGLLEDSITGNAATATSATTLSQTLPVSKGGTGATTSAQARTNLGVPPTSHASTTTTHGVGNSTQYGHVKLSDAVGSSSGVSGGVAATPAAVKAAKDAADSAQASADNAQRSADAAMTRASTLATSSTPGIAMPGTGMTVDADGALNVDTASTSKAGIVQLNNTVTSTSTTQAATAAALKKAYDKAVKAVPIGALVPSFAASIDGYLLCNGAAVSRTTYEELFDVIGTKFGAGDGSKTFNLPDFRDKTFWGADGNLMTVIEAGLPNFNGYFPGVTDSGGGLITGPFSKSGQINPKVQGGNGAYFNNINFDPANVSPVYGKSTTVQPPAIAANFFIKY